MDKFVVKGTKRLKRGYTTGSCAAAAASAAVLMLLKGVRVSNSIITLPSGNALTLDIVDVCANIDCVSCGVVKDAGDDPDATHGLTIYAKAEKSAAGIFVDGGEGVGRVTAKGLQVNVGFAAINPVPMSMITQEVEKVCKACDYNGGINITISIPKGEEVAKKTFNARLGIVGGLSILGTTGIVEPMSEKALIDTIKAEMNMRKEENGEFIIVAPGNYGVEFAKTYLNIDIDQAVKCSNFVGETLDYAHYLGFKKLLFIGHIGKLVKLAAAIMNTHSSTADGRMEILAAHAAMAGGSRAQITQIMNAHTTNEAFEMLQTWGLCESVVETLKQKIAFHLNARVFGEIEIAFIIFLDQQTLLMQSENAAGMLKSGEVKV